ncbi:MAG: nucleotidyl transferase AbiEii/AbiGii toxin family protein [Acidobacteriota bacterium]|nr:nucleotidyl transferase AbiEii/AbiGii toxin family protein [Acidobacteriota bacterium]
MALTVFQRDVCQLLAGRRRAGGESYVAGGIALNVALEAHRLSRDLDLFHDSTEAVARSWDADRLLLEGHGYAVAAIRERPGFVQATASRDHHQLLIEWVHDSAYRFFPLVEHQELGLTLHPFDLATNKVLALIGRLEVRDWIDVIACDERLQPLGYLAWAACGKDPGFSPLGVIDHARRSSQYSAEEVASLAFEGPPPDAADLSRRWRHALDAAPPLIGRLPATEVGKAVLTPSGELFRGGVADLDRCIKTGEIVFHAGRLGGALPRIAG